MTWKLIETGIIGSRSIVQSVERVVISAVILLIIFMDMASSSRSDIYRCSVSRLNCVFVHPGINVNDAKGSQRLRKGRLGMMHPITHKCQLIV